MDDLYMAVGVGETAQTDDIIKKIKQQFRIWNKKINSPDLSKRQEAEKRVALLTRAREVLLDPAKRAEFDRKLAEHKATARSKPLEAATGSWLAQAREYLARNDYHSAAYAAREARNTEGATADVWETLARANGGLNNLQDGLYEARQAAQLDQTNAERHFLVADFLEELGQWDAALTVYQQVRTLPGVGDQADMGTASVYLSTKRYADAKAILERLYSQTDTGKEVIGRYLAIALLCCAEEVPKIQVTDGFVVTSEEEITQMRALASRAFAVTQDSDLHSAASMMEQHLQDCETKRYWPTYPVAEIAKAVAIGGGVTAIFFCMAADFPLGILIGLGVLAITIARIAWVINDRNMFQWQINAERLGRLSTSNLQALTESDLLYDRVDY